MGITPIKAAYAVVSGLLTVTGLILVGSAVRAYVDTNAPSMVYLSLGFTFVVAATVATALSAFLVDFRGAQSLLLIENTFAAIGFVAIVYSLWIHD